MDFFKQLTGFLYFFLQPIHLAGKTEDKLWVAQYIISVFLNTADPFGREDRR